MPSLWSAMAPCAMGRLGILIAFEIKNSTAQRWQNAKWIIQRGLCINTRTNTEASSADTSRYANFMLIKERGEVKVYAVRPNIIFCCGIMANQSTVHTHTHTHTTHTVLDVKNMYLLRVAIKSEATKQHEIIDYEKCMRLFSSFLLILLLSMEFVGSAR